ncbi:peptide ABC transporter substrate-binding protein [Lactobacillus delbrueckii subsp. delbrueckii DSM 20074 = JCM 1012]|uniref:tryptophan ABC transporter substrate-binding protein n=1 Tax=Lactobacillus delbrueckii TaxID=1584 RepID=UPI00069B7C27|nr:tryptophan ABC transporter substrate-binding protein [Lactobacillus delbrueckii]APP09418.1 peptide ABC transporter substrate-binding protein [Lactobacillus delbrueckii subsp. delbrueckii DSM 20074 = JCM 1012]KNZ38434.1 peptide ABC transporter substrate-binding protein [Lactobacillus delbrueckii subsp. delbrueckii]KRK27387.1 peptide ABC transporter substrate-binding protein [Lactobacillus delbrueckii subsp. delbrueckii DSM 20074 = JCM 1012]MCT3493055.1 ABC transporter substrate-binding protei
MKKVLAAFAAIYLFLAAALFINIKPAAQKSKEVRVGVLTLMRHPALDEIYRGYKAGLAKSGYKVKIDYQNANNDQSNLKTMAEKLVNSQDQVLFGITTPSSQALANATKKKPIVLGAVTDPKGAGLVKNNMRPGGNITGVSDRAPIKQQLKLIQRFLPRLKTLGIISTSSDSSAVSGYKQIVSYCKQMGINYKAYSISNSNDLNQVSQQMLTQVDAVIVPTDNTIAGAMQTLVKNANAAKKPVFPAAGTMVKDGGLATYSVDQYQLGLIGAKVTVQILQGKKPGNMAIRYVEHGTLYLNLKEAKKLGTKVPASFLKEAKSKGIIYK